MILNVVTTRIEFIDKPRVLECKVDVCYPEAILAAVLFEMVLKNLDQPELELVAWCIVKLEAVLVNIVAHIFDLGLAQLNFESVVASCNGL